MAEQVFQPDPAYLQAEDNVEITRLTGERTSNSGPRCTPAASG